MGLKDLIETASKTLVSDEKVKATVKKATTNVTSKVKEQTGLDMNVLLSKATSSAAVISALEAIGKKCDTDATSKTVQGLVSKLKTTITKSVGKIDDAQFKSIVTKILSNATVKSTIEKVCGAKAVAYIKKAVNAFVE